MPLRIACQKCNTEYTLSDEKIPKRPARFNCSHCKQEIILVPGNKGMEVTGAKVKMQSSTDLPPNFGQFHDLKRLASGGMGDVYLAKQGGVEGFEREVILKVLHPHLAREERFVKAMVDEAKLTVAMHHPNIVQMFNLERIDKQLCLVMEYVPGMALSAIMRTYRKKGGHMPYPMAIYITHQMLEGLAYAHELKDKDGLPLKIIHRDVSPQNVMVTEDGWVKVIDFGIAKAASRLTHTRTGTVKGKFAYMSPEQFEGLVDQRADVWAAGVVLWETLAGKRLFKGPTDAVTMQRVIALTPTPLHHIRPEIPKAIDKVLAKALDKNPEKRYATARELKNDLLQAAHPLVLDEMASAIDIKADCLGGGPVDPGADPEASDGTTPGSVHFNHSPMEGSDNRTRSYSSIDANPTRNRRFRKLMIGLAVVLLLGGGSGGLWWLLNQDQTLPPDADPPPTVDAGSLAAIDAGTSTITDGGKPDGGKPDGTIPDGSSTDGSSQAPADTNLQAKEDPPRPRPIKLTQRRIEKTLRRHGSKLQACADQNLIKDGRSDVKLKLRFSILRTGRVGKVQLVPASIEATAFGRCMKKRIKKIRFPRHVDKQISISIPLQFRVLK
ncbi:MAG: zinc-ribbon domain-containing protein [Deltaproteobacteria bacterium]|nr:zinc-ribbon domain-containing protein [Deltaproteobacteria bacterium]